MDRKIIITRIYRSYLKDLDQKNITDNGYLYKKRKFDRNGNMLWEVQFLRSGEREIISDFYYNQENNVTDKIVFYPADNTEEKNVFVYNEAGKVTEEKLFIDKQFYMKQETKYNEKNDPVSIENYDAENNLSGKETFEYNDTGQVISHKNFNENNELVWKIKSDYNENEQCIKETHKNYEDESTEFYVFSYNKAGKNFRTENYDDEGNLKGFVEAVYDEEGRPVKYTSETFGYNISKVINQVTYNGSGEIIENEFYDVIKGQLTNSEKNRYNSEGNLHSSERLELTKKNEILQYKLFYNYEYWD